MEVVGVDLISFNRVSSVTGGLGQVQGTGEHLGKGMPCPGVQGMSSTARDKESKLNSEWQQERVNGCEKGVAFQISCPRGEQLRVETKNIHMTQAAEERSTGPDLEEGVVWCPDGGGKLTLPSQWRMSEREGKVLGRKR